MFIKKLKVGIAVLVVLAGAVAVGGGFLFQRQASSVAAEAPRAAADDYQPKAAPRLAVTVRRPLKREAAPFEDFTGRLEAAQIAVVRCRVTGYLKKVHVTEGADVKKGQLLFEIDDAPYKATAARADAALVVAQAQLKVEQARLERVQKLFNLGAVKPEEVDVARATVDATKAAVELARLDATSARASLTATRVLAPVDGRLGRPLVGPGNLVGGEKNATLLARIRVLDPIAVRFDMDERSFLSYERLRREGDLKGIGGGFRVALANDKGFPHAGMLKSFAGEVDPKTGTIAVGGVLPNSKKALLPGMFVRVRLAFGKAQPVLVVPEEAVCADGGKKFLFVVDAQDIVRRRAVKVGQAHDDGRIITEGLGPDDWVVVRGVQRLRPGQRVEPRREPPLPRGR
jgi:RND family efflux transporter MFP subunit